MKVSGKMFWQTATLLLIVVVHFYFVKLVFWGDPFLGQTITRRIVFLFPTVTIFCALILTVHGFGSILLTATGNHQSYNPLLMSWLLGYVFAILFGAMPMTLVGLVAGLWYKYRGTLPFWIPLASALCLPLAASFILAIDWQTERFEEKKTVLVFYSVLAGTVSLICWTIARFFLLRPNDLS